MHFKISLQRFIGIALPVLETAYHCHLHDIDYVFALFKQNPVAFLRISIRLIDISLEF